MSLILRLKNNENWKVIKEFPNYAVSDRGNVKSLNYRQTGREQILKPKKDRYGYLQVKLYKDGKRKDERVHRLVASAFLPNPENKPEVNHKKEFEKTNNCVDNLEWCTYKYNINYGTHNERSAKAKSKPVGQYTLDGELVKVWESTKQASRIGKFDNANISRCCNNRRKTHKGYIWKYVS